MPKFVQFDQSSMYDAKKNHISINVDRIMYFSPSEFFDPTFGKRDCTILYLEGKTTVHVTSNYAEVKAILGST